MRGGGMEGRLLETAAELLHAALVPLSVLWTVFWPARHALLTVALLLIYVHGFEESGEDPYTF
jgi:hypothetical protein